MLNHKIIMRGKNSKIKKCPFCKKIMQCPVCGTRTRHVNRFYKKGKVKSVTCFCSKCLKYFTHRDIGLIKKLKKWEASWLAGLIDGEGSFHATIRNKSVIPAISIVNTSKELMDKVLETVGYGSLVRIERPKPRKAKYVWMLYAHGSRELLPQIIPFLIIKKKAAVALLNFIKTPIWNRDWKEMKENFKEVRSKLGPNEYKVPKDLRKK